MQIQKLNALDTDTVSIAFAIARHADNPWILPRLIKQASFYESDPLVTIADCSNDEYALAPSISDFPSRVQIVHHSGPFNIARLRNVAVAATSSPWLFVTDPDFFTFSNFLPNILQFARDAIASKVTPFFTFPVYHADKNNTRAIEIAHSTHEFNSSLRKFFVKSTFSKIIHNCEFIVPYSNTIFTTKEIFNITGGYNESFVGYGSEDFEFMLRAFMCFNIQPLPKNIFHDIYKPTRDDYYSKCKRYAGFRKFLEAYSFPVETAGFRFVHLWHPQGTTAWHAMRDKNRIALRTELSPLLTDPTLILEKDWLPRPHRALSVITNRANWRFFLPLRSRGYRLHRLMLDESHDAQSIMACARDMDVRMIAFSEDALNRQDTARIVDDVQKKWPHTSIMTSEDVKKIHIHSRRMDDSSYVSARIGPTSQPAISSIAKGIITYAFNKFYDIKHTL